MHEAGLHHAKVNMRNLEAVAYRLLPKDISSDAACAASWWLRMGHKPLIVDFRTAMQAPLRNRQA